MNHSHLRKSIFLFLAIATLGSCRKKKEAPPAQVPDTLEKYLSATGFDKTTVPYKNNELYEFGFSFKPQADGKITIVAAKIPDINPALPITIWDKKTGTAIFTTTLNCTVEDAFFSKEISGVELKANTEYVISMFGNDWYRHEHEKPTAVAYPIAIGNISITGYTLVQTSSSKMPNIYLANYYAGDLSFNFIKN